MNILRYYILGIVLFYVPLLYGQMQTKVYNYTKFTSKSSPDITEELMKQTPEELRSHPEFGFLPYDAPCDDCFELLDKRTDTSRMFVRKGTNGSYFYSQGFYGTPHFDKEGYKLSLDPRLIKKSDGKYVSKRLVTPTVLNINERHSGFEINGETFKFNNKIELVLVKNNAPNESMGEANWSDYTIGDEGIYIKNAWPGIDITISYSQDNIKLNYIIPQPLNYLNNVTNLIFSDNLQLPNNYSIVPENYGANTAQGYSGKYLINNALNQEIFSIDRAYVNDNSTIKENTLFLNYLLDNNQLKLVLPNAWLNTATYPVTIDPLVNTTTVYGPGTMNFRYNGDWCTGPNGYCGYTISTSRPLNSTITDVRFNAQYISSGSCWMNEAAFKIQGPCGISPATAGVFWNCNTASAGTCTATGYSIYSETSSCLTPVCSSVLTYTIQNSYCYSSTSGCVASCQVMPINSWSITVEGRTLEVPGLTTLNPSPCTGSVNLAAGPSFGVPGFTYSWNTGASSPSISVTSAGTYTVNVTDACGVSALQSFTIACPLSIEMNAFEVLKTNDKVLIYWETINETNNDHFVVERLIDDDWEEIGTVKGSLHSNEKLSYKVIDENPFKRGVSYYRLKQVDTDGTVFYFEPKVINFSDDELKIYPQPASDILNIEWTGVTDGKIQFHTLLGEAIDLPINMKNNIFEVNTSKLSSGMYAVSFWVGDEKVFMKRIVIK